MKKAIIFLSVMVGVTLVLLFSVKLLEGSSNKEDIIKAQLKEEEFIYDEDGGYYKKNYSNNTMSDYYSDVKDDKKTEFEELYFYLGLTRYNESSGKYEDNYYHVPVTYIVNNDGDVADMIIKRLKSNNISSSLLSHINYNVEMISYEINDEVMGITFDNDLKNVLFDGELSESIEYALVASFKDSFGVKDVNILFNS